MCIKKICDRRDCNNEIPKLMFRGYDETNTEFSFCSKPCHDHWYDNERCTLTKKDNINPDHYKFGGIETFDYLKAKLSPTQLAGFCKGNIIKYVSRADHKNKVEDLKKAKWYLDKLIEELEND